MNIDKMIDAGKCPCQMYCIVKNTFIEDKIKKEHLCYLCWKDYCKENKIEIEY